MTNKIKNIDNPQNKLDELLIAFSYNLAIVRLQSMMQSANSQQWIKKDRIYQSHSDICFAYKNTLYSVLIDIQDKKGNSFLSKEKIEQQIKASKDSEFVACRFPLVIEKSKKTKPLTDGWNLFNSETNEPVIPSNSDTKTKTRMSDWALLCLCVNYLKEHLISKGYEILYVQDIDFNKPQISYKNISHEECFAVIEVENIKNSKLQINKTKILDNYNQSKIYQANLSVTKVDKKEINYGDRYSINLLEYNIIENNTSLMLNKYKSIKSQNIYDIIINAIKKESISDKEIIGIYPIDNYENLLLKIHSTLVNDIDLLRNDLVLIPYKFDEYLIENSHFGIPLYYITGKDSKYAGMDSLDPDKTIKFNETSTIILKRVAGESVMEPYIKEFLTLCATNIEIKKELNKIIDIARRYGRDAACMAIDYLGNGTYTILPNTFENNSKEIRFNANDDFYKTYKTFVKNYLYTLQKLSELPQKAYDNAVKNIILPKNFAFDFINPRNTRVDYEKEEFNFIDFIYDKKIIIDIDTKLQLDYFKRTLLGLNDKKSYHPPQLLFYQADINKFINYDKNISEKYQLAIQKYA